ncbi:Transposase_IS4 [Hexamita inflata]|uniref:Transposase IS4 n=1 Tax=Hexamita inflata TaxID=28002 RepID=A0AA86UQE2_9EUKA|nr:Transposase IS4 [Hexamita inflata]
MLLLLVLQLGLLLVGYTTGQNQLLMVMQKVENFNHDIYKIKICEITLLNVRICKFSWYSREQPEIVRYYNNNYKGVDYVDQLTKNIKFPGRCTRWTTRMFIYFMQVILVNGFSLMKLLQPEYKEIKITDYVESIIDQMKINLTKYEIKATPRKIEGCNQPVVSPIKGPVIEAYKHYHVYTKVSTQCVGCKQCNSRYVCSCKGYHLCPECYKTHISEQNDIREYTHLQK